MVIELTVKGKGRCGESARGKTRKGRVNEATGVAFYIYERSKQEIAKTRSHKPKGFVLSLGWTGKLPSDIP